MRATRLGRRFPQYRRTEAIIPLARRAYTDREKELGRPLTGQEKLAVRQDAARQVFQRRAGRLPLDPVELEALGEETARREAVAGYDLTFTPVKSVAVLVGARIREHPAADLRCPRGSGRVTRSRGSNPMPR